MLASSSTLALAAAGFYVLPAALAQTVSNETILGVYMFHRHGDRTAKMTPPANLTTLGYQEVYTSGQYYRNRYIDSDATYRINGVNADLVKQSQIAVSAPADTVLQNSATGFLQGLYPPSGSGHDTETLRNGTVITAPMSGYQLIPISLVTSGSGGSGEEDNGWLQGATGCAAATVSSNNYFLSDQYKTLLNSTQDFYETYTPVINNTFASSAISYKNAYTIFDLVNVAEIHNATFDPNNIVTNESFFQLRTLANTHEWGLAYNQSDNMRAIAGKVLAAQIVQFLNGTITGEGSQKIGIQFGAYGTFASFFGLAIPNIETHAPSLMGVADYASAMTFELFTNTSAPVSKTSYPSPDEIYVRFLFHNGTTSNTSEPQVYQLFGMEQDTLSWHDFTSQMNDFAVGTMEQWCTSCGNFTGSCAAYASNSSSSGRGSSTSLSKSTSGNGLSPAVNGVIGAMVTLAVVLGIEGLILLLGGWRVVSKKSLARGPAEHVRDGPVKA
ncbi:histidine acid phosphatase like protein [Teratosphaeria destructans]|uniref:Histidine acid phosphatase like protein n=1 Tax=Teratosphaeria destructans TaxID=418781 RepID=A0A9W7SRL5_9PEZI|nr:histidine acid phosphatase like protein [Teratosphaeria destructans]